MTRPVSIHALRRLGFAGLMAALATMTIGCATPPASAPGMAAADRSEAAERATGVFASPEAAAISALQDVRRSMRQSDQRHLHVGAIVRVDRGYAWLPPVQSRRADRPIVRLQLDDRQVATYIVHPRTGEPSIDRANSVVTRDERRIVDEMDPQHRPIFVLTPKGRLLSYAFEASVVEVADLRHGRTPEPARVVDLVAYDSGTD